MLVPARERSRSRLFRAATACPARLLVNLDLL